MTNLHAKQFSYSQTHIFHKRTTRSTALHALQQQSAYCVTDNGKCMDNALGKIRLFVKLKHKKKTPQKRRQSFYGVEK